LGFGWGVYLHVVFHGKSSQSRHAAVPTEGFLGKVIREKAPQKRNCQLTLAKGAGEEYSKPNGEKKKNNKANFNY